MRSKVEISDILRKGLRYECSCFTAIFSPNRKKFDRTAVLVGKRHGNSVQRNRLKRIVREAQRSCAGTQSACLDILIKPKVGCQGNFFDYQKAYRKWRERLS